MPFSGYSELNPQFAEALQRYLAAVHGVTPTSGYRSVARQQQLWDASDKSGHMVARPGHSQHNLGMAVDLSFADPATRAKAHELAAQYGLTFPMSWEPWHIELAGARGKAPGGTTTPTATASFTPPPIPSPDPAQMAGEKLGNAVANLAPPPSNVGTNDAMPAVSYSGGEGPPTPSVLRQQFRPTMVGGQQPDMRQMLAMLMGGRTA